MIYQEVLQAFENRLQRLQDRPVGLTQDEVGHYNAELTYFDSGQLLQDLLYHLARFYDTGQACGAEIAGTVSDSDKYPRVRYLLALAGIRPE